MTIEVNIQVLIHTGSLRILNALMHTSGCNHRSWTDSRKLSEHRSLINSIGRLMSRMSRGKSVSFTMQNTGTIGGGGGGMTMEPVRTGTFADQVCTVEGMAHTEKYKDFIQVITRAHGKVQTIILPSQEQVADMKRSCSPGPNGARSVMTFDKTFNLADVYVMR